MNDAVASLLAAIDSGAITPEAAPSAIQQSGGLAYILCNLALP